MIPSLWYETYNFVLREALQSGCLVLAPRVGAMPEAISEGENGYAFETGSVEDLRDKLNKALSFDWAKYRAGKFPTPAEESRRYSGLYMQAIQDEKRKGSNDV